MNREIKFRAYIKKSYHNELVGTICNVSSIHLKTKKAIIGYSISRSVYGNASFSFDDIELMQYTGLKDKNGVEIYEGDILAYIYYKYSNDEYGHKGFYRKLFEIYYDETDMRFNYRFIKLEEIEMPKDYKESYREVIGNVFENGELLKESEE